MNEQYVSFEVAKLLKENGFDWPCICYYEDNGIMHEALDYVRQNDGEDDDNDECLCPTQQMACSWLREVHNIFIGVDIGEDIDGQFGYMPFIHILDNLSCSDARYVPDVDADDICDLTPQSYEDAVEVALKYVLKNLI